MKTGLVEHANKRPKIMCLYPVWGGKGKGDEVRSQPLSQFWNKKKKWAQLECQVLTQKQRSTSEIQGSWVQTKSLKMQCFELAIKNQNWKWKAHYLTASPYPKYYCNSCLSVNSAALPTTGPLLPKMCCLGALLRERSTIWSSLCSLQPWLSKLE